MHALSLSPFFSAPLAIALTFVRLLPSPSSLLSLSALPIKFSYKCFIWHYYSRIIIIIIIIWVAIYHAGRCEMEYILAYLHYSPVESTFGVSKRCRSRSSFTSNLLPSTIRNGLLGDCRCAKACRGHANNQRMRNSVLILWDTAICAQLKAVHYKLL